ncbi:helix-turn-helix domain-containing protein [Saccharothrix deserti]|uniref:helix-turn-helix domain-containing protein n=1 Tax=Saccharothrix deserti TaxID=2593674 RepID=UPI00131A61A6|nr:helix-turn-helix domain-containing protein [Saccharothrix deserti]
MILPRDPSDPVAVIVLDPDDARMLIRLVQLGLGARLQLGGGGRPSPHLDALLTDLHQAAAEPVRLPMSADGPESEPAAIVEISTAEAALRLGCTPRHARRLALTGHLPARVVGGVWLFDANSLPELEDDEHGAEHLAQAEPVAGDPGQGRS